MMRNRPDPAGLYRPAMPGTWWLRKASYFRFVVRELTSVFIAAYLVLLMVQLYRLGESPESFAAFSRALAAPGWIVFHLVVLAFAAYHSVTWFQTTSIVMELRLGDRVLPRALFTGLNVGLWLGVSVALVAIYAIV